MTYEKCCICNINLNFNKHILLKKKKKIPSINISKSNTTIIYLLKTIECGQKLYFGHITEFSLIKEKKLIIGIYKNREVRFEP